MNDTEQHIKIPYSNLNTFATPSIHWEHLGLKFDNVRNDGKDMCAVCEIIDKQKFAWACVKYGIQFETYNRYKTRYTRTTVIPKSTVIF